MLVNYKDNENVKLQAMNIKCDRKKATSQKHSKPSLKINPRKCKNMSESAMKTELLQKLSVPFMNIWYYILKFGIEKFFYWLIHAPRWMINFSPIYERTNECFVVSLRMRYKEVWKNQWIMWIMSVFGNDIICDKQ